MHQKYYVFRQNFNLIRYFFIFHYRDRYFKFRLKCHAFIK